MPNPSDFQACLDLVWQFDGLRHDGAIGEPFTTSYGVTGYTWRMAVFQGIVPDISIDMATKEECADILHVMFYNALKCSTMPPGINLMVFNDGMVCGVGHVTRLVQRLIGVQVDGVMGPVTLRVLNGHGPAEMIDRLAEADEDYYKVLAKAPLFLKGWTRREEFMRHQAHLMNGSS